MVDVEKMSDAELRAELSVRGQIVGPVTGTTRSLYEKKLKKLIAAGGKTPARPAAAAVKPAASANKSISKPPPKVTPAAKPPVVKKPAEKTPDTSRRSFPRAAASAANSSINSTFNRSEVEEDVSDSDEEKEDDEEILSPSVFTGIKRAPQRPVSSTPTKHLSPKAKEAPKSVYQPRTAAGTPKTSTSTTIRTSTSSRIPSTPPRSSVQIPNLITDFTPSFSTFSTFTGDRPGATPPRGRKPTANLYTSNVLQDLGNTTGEDDDDYEGQESSRIIYKSKEPSKGLVKNAWNKVLGYGFNASETPGESYDLRAGSTRIRVQKNAKTGKVNVKQTNVCNDAMMTAFYALLILLAVLSVAYCLTTQHPEKANFLGWWGVLKAAGRDSLNFFYNYAILPVVSLGLLVLLGAGLFFGHRKYKEAQDHEESQLYDLIERITDLVQMSAADGDPYVSQPHVRDVMFPPAKRRSAEMARWEKAVKFIDTNESRVATDIIVLPSGNECAVWKWIGNANQRRKW